MPQNIRNYWLKGEIEGQRTKIACGPVRKDGSMYLELLLREEKQISGKKLNIECLSNGIENDLIVKFDNQIVFQTTLKR